MNTSKISIQELIDVIAQQTGISKKKAEEFLKVLQSTIEDGLINDRIVKIKGLGTFKLIWNEARKSINVQTGEEYIIPGHTKVSFVPDAQLKELINDKGVKTNESTLPDPLEKLNEQAEEIKGIIADIKEMKKTEPALIQPSESIEEMVKPEPELTNTTVNPTQNEEQVSIQSATLTEKHVLQERDLPIKKKRKEKHVVFFLLVFLVVAGGVGGYLLYKDTVLGPYIVKAESKAKALKDKLVAIFEKSEAENEVLVVEESISTTPLDENMADNATEDEKPPVEAPKSTKKEPVKKVAQQSVFEMPRNQKETITTEVVEKGERLVVYAEKYYGHKDFWVYIYEANSNVLKSPGSVQVGMRIKIPKLNPKLIDINNPEALKYAKQLERNYLQ